MNNTGMFHWVFVVGIAATFIIRLRVRLRRSREPLERRSQALERALMGLTFAGVVVAPLLYVCFGIFDGADYALPEWAGWAGTGTFAAALWLLWRTHVDLGQNWSPTLEVTRGQTLTTSGVYRRIRHPMYAAFWLTGISQTLLLQNWIAGFSNLATFALLYFVRVPREERMMREYFGEQYDSWVRNTGRVIPRWS